MYAIISHRMNQEVHKKKCFTLSIVKEENISYGMITEDSIMQGNTATNKELKHQISSNTIGNRNEEKEYLNASEGSMSDVDYPVYNSIDGIEIHEYDEINVEKVLAHEYEDTCIKKKGDIYSDRTSNDMEFESGADEIVCNDLELSNASANNDQEVYVNQADCEVSASEEEERASMNVSRETSYVSGNDEEKEVLCKEETMQDLYVNQQIIEVMRYVSDYDGSEDEEEVLDNGEKEVPCKEGTMQDHIIEESTEVNKEVPCKQGTMMDYVTVEENTKVIDKITDRKKLEQTSRKEVQYDVHEDKKGGISGMSAEENEQRDFAYENID